MTSHLNVDNLEIRYGDTAVEPAITGINLEIMQGEFVTVIGPSGCGKSTLLHAMGGMLAPASGGIYLDGTELTRPDPRQAAFVFQDYSLFPWKKVVDNVAMGLRFAGEDKKTALEKAAAELAFVGLGDKADKYPGELSGGMQQRVAVARALALKPKFLLMDEPFGALDEQTRRSLGQELTKILHDAGQSVVLITHSLEEAIFWADRIIVMKAGPGEVSKEIIVDEPWPRSLEFMTSERFENLRAELFHRIQPTTVSEAK
ncbi:MAG: NitT/TauT family transport system ATP-binding protein [Homoserinimonas sp.]|jgi:NitT/TauT family transport system ATP-binding protein|nr:NitT/TauT family transport system ATP-binding protein [Homoserinimonas sp.]